MNNFPMFRLSEEKVANQFIEKNKIQNIERSLHFKTFIREQSLD